MVPGPGVHEISSWHWQLLVMTTLKRDFCILYDYACTFHTQIFPTCGATLSEFMTANLLVVNRLAIAPRQGLQTWSV